MIETTEAIVEQVVQAEPTFMNWFVDLFYYPDNLVKTFLAVLGLGFMLVVLFEMMYILKQASFSSK